MPPVACPPPCPLANCTWPFVLLLARLPVAFMPEGGPANVFFTVDLFAPPLANTGSVPSFGRMNEDVVSCTLKEKSSSLLATFLFRELKSCVREYEYDVDFDGTHVDSSALSSCSA